MLNVNVTDRIATITIDRPQRRNAIDADTGAQLNEQLKRFAASGDISAVILTGTLPGFCAGSDLKELAGKTVTEMRDIELTKGGLIDTMINVAPPIVAAVEGFALGGGFVLAAACDFVVTGNQAKWHMPEGQNGWIPPWGIEALTLRVGHFRARQMVFGLRLTGQEAVAAQVADRAVEDGSALQEAQRIATDLTQLTPTVLATIKRYFARDLSSAIGTADQQSAQLFADNCKSEPALSTLARFGVRNG